MSMLGSIQITMTCRFIAIIALFVFFCNIPDLRAEGLPAAEKKKIEALLAHVGGLPDAEFIRNGKAYDAKSAVKFLRGKWEANEKKINSAADFIVVAATRSSTTGKPYMIHLKGAAPTRCADYLSAQLRKLEMDKGG
jgi:Family of unknown function (DUF5329)